MNAVDDWQRELSTQQHEQTAAWFDWYRHRLADGTLTVPPAPVTARMVFAHCRGVQSAIHVEWAYAALSSRPSRVILPRSMLFDPSRVTDADRAAMARTWQDVAESSVRASFSVPGPVIANDVSIRWPYPDAPRRRWWTPAGRVDHTGPPSMFTGDFGDDVTRGAVAVLTAPIALIVAAGALCVLGYRRFGRLCVGDW